MPKERKARIYETDAACGRAVRAVMTKWEAHSGATYDRKAARTAMTTWLSMVSLTHATARSMLRLLNSTATAIEQADKSARLVDWNDLNTVVRDYRVAQSQAAARAAATL